MLVLVVVLCVLAVVAIAIALTGPRRWYLTVRTQTRPGAIEPTDAGYRWLSWRNWFVAAVLTTAAVVAIEYVVISEDEFYDVTHRAVETLDGTIGVVGSSRIKAVVETAAHREIFVKEIEPAGSESSSDREGDKKYELRLKEKGGPAICVEIQTSTRLQTGIQYIYTTVNQGTC